MPRLSFLLAMTTMIFFCTTLLTPDRAYACSCATGFDVTEKERVEEAYSRAGAVFAGKVAGIESQQPASDSMEPIRVTFGVSKTWKGPWAQTLEVNTAASSASCGYEFRAGREYLVYASEDMQVSLCSETKPLSAAEVDLDTLGAVEQTTGGNDALPDTSGVAGFARLAPYAVAGAAGLVAVLVTSVIFLFSREPSRRP